MGGEREREIGYRRGQDLGRIGNNFCNVGNIFQYRKQVDTEMGTIK